MIAKEYAFAKEYPFYLGNQPLTSKTKSSVLDKYTGKEISKVSMADRSTLLKAIELAEAATKPMRALAAFERQEILLHCVNCFKEREAEFIDLLCMEAGKPLKDAKSEIERLLSTFKVAAEEATRIYGEVLPLDIGPRGVGYTGQWKRVPIGPCLFITPFNFPFNLPAHKIAPAIAMGCPFILKPAPQTPIGALMIGEVLAETKLPKGAFSILPCEVQDAEVLVTDPRLKLLSFTGSAKAGWDLKTKAGKKQVVLELGGNAACIVDQNVDLDHVADRLTFGSFYYAGQSCISVQRIYIHDSIYDVLREKLVEKAKNLKYGNPKEKDTLGPVIDEGAAKRIEDWVQEAVQKGAKILCGGTRKGALYAPTLLEKVGEDQKAYSEEIFGPVALLEPFHDFEKALEKVNNSRYGLQAGVFTKDLDKAYQAWNTLEVGGVIINDVPSWRSDNMPYGGTKDSGLGREGVRFAMEHMSEIRLMVMNLQG